MLLRAVGFMALILPSSVTQYIGNSCAQGAAPYKITVDKTGKPELHCDTPTCFEVRREDVFCTHSLHEGVCDGPTEWTSGLVEIDNGTHRTLKTSCCTYDGLVDGSELKTILLEAGDVYDGGSIRVNRDEFAFDIVKEVRKSMDSENRLQYAVTVFRLPCESEGEKRALVPMHTTMKRRNNREDQYDDYSDVPAGRRRRAAFDDYDFGFNYPRARKTFGRRIRRRPVMDYYDDYDAYYFFPARAALRRQRMLKLSALMRDDRLWPIFGPQPQEKPTEQQQPIAQLPLPKTIRRQPMAAPLPVAFDTDISNGAQALPESTATDSLLQSLQYEAFTQAAPQSLQPLQPLGPVAPLNSYPSGPVAMHVVSDPGYGYQNNYVQAPYDSDSYAHPIQHSHDLNYKHGFHEKDPYAGKGLGNKNGQFAPRGPPIRAGPGPMNSFFSTNPMQCFSGDMEVDTPEGTKLMRDLKTGDSVLTVEDNLVNYSPVIMFLHKDHDEQAEFNILHTAEHSLSLTDDHLIYVTDCSAAGDLRLVRAREVAVGECVFVTYVKARLVPAPVINITRVSSTGIYAPLTVTGDIIVNGVLASCHSSLPFKTLQQSLFTVYRSVSRAMASVLPSYFSDTNDDHHDIPLGVTYLAEALELFMPMS